MTSFRPFALDRLHNETRFPTAMSYGSGDQWSDNATICSDESVGENSDTGSLPSTQEDHLDTRTEVALPLATMCKSVPSCPVTSDESTNTGSPVDEMNSGARQKDQDCDASLDVETHSVGGHSFSTILSQDDASVATASQYEYVADLGAVIPIDKNGRQSPGGTIYKGRGERRYQGRYMHLPLKRFHHQVQDQSLFAEPSPKRRVVDRSFRRK